MSRGTVVLFPNTPEARAAAARLEAAREAHIQAFQDWLRVAAPSRDDAEMETEIFAGTARQLTTRHTKPPRT